MRAVRNSCKGQATVEFALLLPVVVVTLLVIAQIGLVSRARVMVTHAAREGARIAAVGGSDADVTNAVVEAGSLERQQVSVNVVRETSVVKVLVVYTMKTNVSVVGAVLKDPQMSAVAVMYRER